MLSNCYSGHFEDTEAWKWRKLLAHERLVLDKILSQDFAGADQLRRQVDAADVVDLDDDGSLGFVRSSVEAADPGHVPIKQTVPLETFYADSDGFNVYESLLIDKTGVIRALDVYKEDGSVILSLPTENSLQLY